VNRAIESVFRECFLGSHRTQLSGGAPEPLYLPGCDASVAQIYYREDFAASALHEVAHWCIAGPERRRQVDYGYWYAPDGRDVAAQREFERVEVRPQALEWHFALACGCPFRISIDNLQGCGPAGEAFAAAVRAQAIGWCSQPLPERAGVFRGALAAAFGGIAEPAPGDFPHVRA